MADTPAPEFLRFVAEERRAQRLSAPQPAMAAGVVSEPIFVSGEQASALLRVAAKRAAGLIRPTRRTEVVWVRGDSELAINLAAITAKIAAGLITVTIPVRCDQTGNASVDVFFAAGSPVQPAGLYASTLRRPSGPPLIVGVWGEALVAFAWQCVLGMVSGIAGATGKDARGNVLVPLEMAASERGLQIVPMARHRFMGSSGLKATTATGTPIARPNE
ncbi:MAG TPA: hypothetical protein VLN49_02630 [Gemmatimonadaceae bacterium]|nr:hypothetical protein [Gemmatimonadaceae bacterium]